MPISPVISAETHHDTVDTTKGLKAKPGSCPEAQIIAYRARASTRLLESLIEGFSPQVELADGHCVLQLQRWADYEASAHYISSRAYNIGYGKKK